MRTPIAGAAVLALVAAAAGCGSSGGGVTNDDGIATIKAGVIPIVDVAPIYLGQRKGFFASRRIQLTMESGQGGAAIVPGVVSGQFQVGFSNITSLLIAQTKNVPVRIVANGVASTGVAGKDFGGVAVGKGSAITKPAGLAGRKIAVNTLKNIGDTTVRESVRKAGGEPSALQFVEMPFANMPAAVANGQVDAAFVVEPALSQIVSAGGRVVAWCYVDPAPDLTVAAWFASTRLIADDPDLVKRFTEAMNESLTYADSHPGEVREILGTYTKIDPELRERLTLPRWPTEINRASVQRLADLGGQDGIFGTATSDPAKILP
jgi:NitT/TauT family transport system substrate-binding protein